MTRIVHHGLDGMLIGSCLRLREDSLVHLDEFQEEYTGRPLVASIFYFSYKFQNHSLLLYADLPAKLIYLVVHSTNHGLAISAFDLYATSLNLERFPQGDSYLEQKIDLSSVRVMDGLMTIPYYRTNSMLEGF